MWKYLDEVLGIIIVVGCFILIFCHIDSEVKTILSVAATWVFSREAHKRIGKTG
jgi:hypothetical protein